MSGVNFSKIRKAFPDIENSQSSEDLRRIAEKLDSAEELEGLMKSEFAKPILDHFRSNFGTTLAAIFENVADHQKLVPLIERLRILTELYKTYGHASEDAEFLRNMVDELLAENA